MRTPLQSDILRKYMASVPRPGRSLLVVSYLGVWTKARCICSN